MDSIFRKYDFVIVYIDDILVHSQNEEDHVQHLAVFTSECEKHGIVLSHKKLELFRTTMEFLGICIIDGKIQMQSHIVQKIVGFPDQLENKNQIQFFLGILNYVHKYIPRLAEKTAAIRQHLSGGWSPTATMAVQQLKEECQSLPQLKPPGNGKLILQTDASDEFWATILLEKIDGEEHICAYKSGEFTYA